MSKIKIQPHILTGIIAAIASITILLLFVLPSINDIRDLKKTISSERQKLEQLRLAGKTQKKAINDYLEIRDQIPRLDNLILKKGEELDFITKIEESASKANIEVTIDFNTALLKTKGEQQTVQKVPMQINATGKYLNILAFMEQIEQYESYVLVTSLQINTLYSKSYIPGFGSIRQEPDKNDDGSVRATINTMTYWL